MDKGKMTRAEALEQISMALAQLPESELSNASSHLIGIINGMVMALEIRKAKDGAA